MGCALWCHMRCHGCNSTVPCGHDLWLAPCVDSRPMCPVPKVVLWGYCPMVGPCPSDHPRRFSAGALHGALLSVPYGFRPRACTLGRYIHVFGVLCLGSTSIYVSSRFGSSHRSFRFTIYDWMLQSILLVLATMAVPSAPVDVAFHKLRGKPPVLTLKVDGLPPEYEGTIRCQLPIEIEIRSRQAARRDGDPQQGAPNAPPLRGPDAQPPAAPPPESPDGPRVQQDGRGGDPLPGAAGTDDDPKSAVRDGEASSEVEIMGEMPVLPPDSLVTPEAEVAAAGCGAARPAQVVSLGAVSKTERPGEESKLDKKSPMHPENATRGHTADTRGRPVLATTPSLPTENHNVAPVMPVAVASPALPASDEGEPGHKRLRRSSFCDAAPSAAKWWLPIAGRTSATQADRDSVPELRQSARAAAAPSSQRQMRNAFQML
eukprot:9469745-Pyramimonas_sp.AAC.1